MKHKQHCDSGREQLLQVGINTDDKVEPDV